MLTAESSLRLCSFRTAFWLSSCLSGCFSSISICGHLHCLVPKMWGPPGPPLFLCIPYILCNLILARGFTSHACDFRSAAQTLPDPQTPMFRQGVPQNPPAQWPDKFLLKPVSPPRAPAQRGNLQALSWPSCKPKSHSPLYPYFATPSTHRPSFLKI